MLASVKASKSAWQGDSRGRLLELLTVLVGAFNHHIARLADSMLHYDNIVISLRKRNEITVGCRGTPQNYRPCSK